MANHQRARTLQQARTTFTGAQVLEAARIFFARKNSIYSAFPEKEGPTFLVLRGQGGEEVAIAVSPVPGGNRVRGSTLLFDQALDRFLSTLPAPADLSA